MTSKGFTLIELMIVVAIIAIIAAIAIPNLLRSRMSANEANAVGGTRTIASGEVSYQAAAVRTNGVSGMGQYGSLTQMSAANPQFIDSSIGSGSKSGYTFVATASDDAAAPSFAATASPASSNTGTRYYFVNESGVVRFSTSGTATASSSPLN